jgi:RNA polymerase sigma-70 factor, ECF subfamily
VRRWVKQARDGDEEAFGELVKTYHQQVYNVVYGLVSHADDAKELAQQSWVKAWSKLGSFKQDSGFFTWVYRIASNTAFDFLRRKGRRGEEELVDGVEPVSDARFERAPSEVTRPDREIEYAEIRAVFQAALGEISPEHRLALTLREVEGLSYEEIARVMDCRKGTVMSRIFYARQKIQEKMKGLL